MVNIFNTHGGFYHLQKMMENHHIGQFPIIRFARNAVFRPQHCIFQRAFRAAESADSPNVLLLKQLSIKSA